MLEVYLDIETIPGQQPWVREHVAAGVHPPGNMSKPETIKKWEEEKREDQVEFQWSMTGLDATFGEVVVISWAIGDGEVQSLSRDYLDKDYPESALIANFLQSIDAARRMGNHVEQVKYIGHNVLFDIRFLWRRGVINSVSLTQALPYNVKPWSDEIVDTLQLWTQGDRQTKGALDTLCKAFGASGGKTMSGADVWPAIQNGELESVVDYCKTDVTLCRFIHKRMMFL